MVAKGLALNVIPVNTTPERPANKPPTAYSLIRVRLTFTPERNAASLFDPIAYIAIPVRLRYSGIQITSRGRISQTSGGIKLGSFPPIRSATPWLIPPPGFGITNMATPTNKKLVANVTTMSAIPDAETIQPVIAPIRPPTATKKIARRSDVVKDVPAMYLALKQLIKTASAPIARLIPPPIMMIACPIDSNAIGKIPKMKVRASYDPNCGSWLILQAPRMRTKTTIPIFQLCLRA